MAGILDYQTIELTCTKCGKKVPRLFRNLDHKPGAFLCPDCVEHAKIEDARRKVFVRYRKEKLPDGEPSGG